MQLKRCALLGILSSTLLLTGCSFEPDLVPENLTKPVVTSPSEKILTTMQGSAKVDNGDKETKVTYIFTNHTKEKQRCRQHLARANPPTPSCST
ncbi:hypothetical protein J2736_006894 [Paenibacillus qinlingensis]|uniref:Uncharacterized protein n=1 Tax=Paenibacillus qinlingensis TaxID=1837343 RepID=A0ABU1P7G0_9BACL|nr:hypothetical protein [Paenibacillus qinlingensis]